MGCRLLISVDPERTPVEKKEGCKGLTLKQVAYFGSALLNVTPENSQSSLHFLRNNFGKLSIYLDVRKLRSWSEIIDCLNAGASKVFVTFEQLKVLIQEPTISRDRLVLTISPKNPKTDLIKLNAFLETEPKWKLRDWAFDGDRGGEYVDAVLKELGNFPPSTDQTVYVSISDQTGSEELLHKYPGDAPIVPAERLTLSNDDEELISAPKLAVAGATKDRKTGLYTTSVVDEHGVALGLVYSSDESIAEALRTGTGVYQSRKRGLWYKGQTSGDTQELISIGFDCDNDCLLFRVRQQGRGFCHLGTQSCWGHVGGLSRLQKTLRERKRDAPEGSYTARLFNDAKLVSAKIKEEADELCEATDKEHIAAEAADLLYFALTRCIAADVQLEDIERNLDLKSLKVKRRKGDAKPQYIDEALHADKDKPLTNGTNGVSGTQEELPPQIKEAVKEAASIPKSESDPAGTSEEGRISMKRFSTEQAFSDDILKEALQRPSQHSTDTIMNLVKPIISEVRQDGDIAVLRYTHKFEKATSLKSPVLKAPFPKELMQLEEVTIKAINTSYDNILKFHHAQKESAPLQVETMPGVVCSRFSRPIEKVGLYVPGGTAVLPSTALMLGVPAMAAGCKNIILASPPRSDGTITPEIVYIAHKIGAESIVLAGGAQAVAAMAYGTESISKVDKILGPGNQFVTAAKMIVSNDTTASVSIDMPAGPSEVLVIADKTANPAFVASDLLSQAEHGVDSQVILISIDLTEDQQQAIEDELHKQAYALPRIDIVRGAIDHSVTISVSSRKEALKWSNYYAPEHLILQIDDAAVLLPDITNAGSVFIGSWTPESVGDYSAGVNHSLPTYGYARQYSGVNLGSFMKHITSSHLTEEGLRNVGSAVMELARVEGLEAHRRAVEIRLESLRG